MPLEKQNISFDFGKGLNEVVDSDLVADGTLLKVTDGVYNKAGRIDKRHGYEAIGNSVLSSSPSKENSWSPSSILTRASGIHNSNGTLVASEDNRVLSYAESEDAWRPSSGYYRSCAISKRDVVGNQGNIIRSSKVVLGNIAVVVFATEDHVTGYKVIDKKSGSTIYITHDINLQLWGGTYNDTANGGANGASQYTEPTVISTGNKIWIFVVKDRYNFPITGNHVPTATLPSGDGRLNHGVNPPVYTGCMEAPKLIMFGLNLTTYELQYNSVIGYGKYHTYFNLEKFNNWNREATPLVPPPITTGMQPAVPVPQSPFVNSVGGGYVDGGQTGNVTATLGWPSGWYNFFSDHRYLSYDVCQFRYINKFPESGQVIPSSNFFTVLVSSYEAVVLFSVDANSGQMVSHRFVGLNGDTSPPHNIVGGSLGYKRFVVAYDDGTAVGSASLFPFNHVALGQNSSLGSFSGKDIVRTWCWRYNNSSLAPLETNMCFMRGYEVDPVSGSLSVLANNTGGGVDLPGGDFIEGFAFSDIVPTPLDPFPTPEREIGLYIPSLDNAVRPWSSVNSHDEKNIIGIQIESRAAPAMVASPSQVSNIVMEVSPTATEVIDAQWRTSELKLPNMSSVVSEPFLYSREVRPSLHSRSMAIALTPDTVRWNYRHATLPGHPTGEPGKDFLNTTFIMAEGSSQNIIAKYSQAMTVKEVWGKAVAVSYSALFDDNSEVGNGVLSYNSDWSSVFSLSVPVPHEPIDMSANGGVHSNIGQFTSPRQVALLTASGFYSTPSFVDVNLDKFELCTNESIQAEVEDGLIDGDGRVREVLFDLSPSATPDFINYSSDLYLNGGYLGIFDNSVIAENNFHLPPDFFLSKGQEEYPPPVPTDYWAYCCTYEWIDDNGNLHRSQPSRILYTKDDPSSTDVQLCINEPIFTSKKIHEIQIAVYRTIENGSVFYRVSKLTPNTFPTAPGDPNSASGENRSIRCSGVGTFSRFTDVLEDDDITGNELLYTTGGILANVAPPSFNVMAEFGGRIFGSGLDNPSRIYYSKLKSANTSVEFSDALYIDISPEGGDITGLSVLDSNLIIFKENKVFRIYGEGPNNSGVGGRFSEPLLISSSHGAKTKKAILNTVEGVIFRGGDGGIYLLDRSLNFSYIGGPVADSNDLDIVHSTNVGSESEIRFILENGEALIYNYWFKVWTRFSNHASLDSTYWNDKFVMARTTTFESPKGIWVQTPNSYLDLTEPVLLDVETSWIKLAGIKGYQRCNWLSLLGSQDTSHDVDVTLYRDYNPDPYEQLTVDGAKIFNLNLFGSSSCGYYGDAECGVYGWPGDTVYQWRHKPQIQKCESIKLKFKDKAELSGIYDPSAATNFSLKNLTLYIGVKKGQFKLPERKTV